MATDGGGASQVISLPQGGGALQGIGEKFAPDLHTGTGNFSVPISLPGRSGLQPTLSLSYSTGSGNGPFGLGWSLSVPGVTRQTSKGLPRYDDAGDIFVLSGAEDLVPVPGGPPGATRYRPRTEGLFARITHHRDTENDHWEVRTQDGMVSLYGTPGAVGSDPAVVADPNDRARIFAWSLTSTVDTFGNRIEYQYVRDEPPVDSLRRWDQLYLSEIRYADFGDPAAPRFLVSVRFVYDERPDQFSDHRPGFEVRTTRRCTRIEIRTHAEAERLTRTYHLTYLDQRVVGADELPLNGVSLLSSVQVVGHDGDETESLPPLDVGYTRFEPRRRDFVPIEGPDLPPSSLANPDFELADLIGNGLPGMLEMNGTVRYWRNLGGRFDRPREMREAPTGVGLADPGVQLLDANGDGRLDLLVTTDALSGYFPLQFGGFWDRRSFQRYRLAPSFALDDPEVRLIDLDGDGVTDAIRSGARFACFFNDPKDGWIATRRVDRRGLDAFPNVSFADERVRLADITGDGLQDVVLVYDGCVEYWASLGRGDWGRRVSMANSPRFPFGYDPKRVLMDDVDGDGLADLVYVDDRKVTLWMNQGGERWSDPIEIRGTPRVSDRDSVRLVDLLGNGVAGLLWSRDVDGTRPSLLFLDFTGGIKPYLLQSMDNHMGAVTRVEYAPSTRFYLEDERRPETRWKTPLPFPVQVVARVEVIDQISGGKLTTEYRYHHGYWDGVEREFRGFGRVDQRDTEVFERYNAPGRHGDGQAFEPVARQMFSPPTETRTWFHQGAIDGEDGDWTEADYGPEYWPGDPPALARPSALDDLLRSLPRSDRRDALRALRGSVLRTELYALDGSERQDRPFTVTESLYGLREESAPGPDEDGRQRIFFPHPLAQRATQWERGDDPQTQLTFADEYDAYGHPRSKIALAVPRGRHYREPAPPGEPYLATWTVTDHAQRDDADRYLAGRVARATTYEIVNDGSLGAFELHAAIVASSAARELIGQTLTFFDGPAFEGLPFGQLGDHGLVSRIETLALTEEILREAYAADGSPEMPPYLVPDGPPPWTDEYPQEFRDRLAPLAGYVFRPGGPDSPHTRGYFVVSERRRYDCQANADGRGRGLLLATRDPLGHESRVTYDDFALFAVEARNPVGLVTSAAYDYRVLSPSEATDPNGNRLAYSYTPLGLLATVARLGKVGESVADSPDTPSTRYRYDHSSFDDRRQPISIRTIRRVRHSGDASTPTERDRTIESVEYADGQGRLVQKRTQTDDVVFGSSRFGDVGLPADQSAPPDDAVGRLRPAGDPPRVVVSGWQVYDNKGQVVEKYEPFFASGFDFAVPTVDELGRKAIVYYDARGQPVRTVNPDGTEQRVVRGTPARLDDPADYEPNPWETYTYDANDNGGRTHQAASNGYRDHWDTPTSTVADALGRVTATTVRNGLDLLVTRSTFDIRGNPLAMTDPLGRVVARQVYDLADRPLRVAWLDGGVRRVVFDAGGAATEQRDPRGALALHARDVLRRPIRTWARDAVDQPLRLRQRLVYGDADDAGLSRSESASLNLLGRLRAHYDEAGLIEVEGYDFKGNVVAKSRRVIADGAILDVFESAASDGWRVRSFGVDWQPPDGTTLAVHAAAMLEPTEYRTSFEYDGLDRLVLVRCPEDVDGKRKVVRPRYGGGGALVGVDLDGASVVDLIAYDARGRRTLIAYGNGVMTRYAYDPDSARMARLRTERFLQTAETVFEPRGQALQDYGYDYDLVGNIVAIRDRSPSSGAPDAPLGPDALDRLFAYDSLYRLVSATGRECDLPSESAPWDDRPRCVDVTRSRTYVERYQYDAVDNLTRLDHRAGHGGFARTLRLASGSNRLADLTVGSTTYEYAYDSNGNTVRESTSRHLEWDHADRPRTFRTQVQGSEPSVHTHYLYDAAGQRVKKLTRKQGGLVEVTVYVDGLFERRRVVRTGSQDVSDTINVVDGGRRVATFRVGPPLRDDTTPAVKYELGDHLNSTNLVLDGNGALIDREEFTPYGETSFGSFARKRYRFAGKERDEESGLACYGLRYYAPWLGRWLSCDPLGLKDGTNLYVFCRANPVRFTDPRGAQSEESAAVKEKPKSGTRENPIVVHDVRDVMPMFDKLPEEHRERIEAGEPFFKSKQVSGWAGETGDPDVLGGASTVWFRYVPQTALDHLTQATNVLSGNLEVGSKEGVDSGGVPGGRGPKENAGALAQSAYIVVTVLTTIGAPIARGAKWLGKGAARLWNSTLGKVLNKPIASAWKSAMKRLGWAKSAAPLPSPSRPPAGLLPALTGPSQAVQDAHRRVQGYLGPLRGDMGVYDITPQAQATLSQMAGYWGVTPDQLLALALEGVDTTMISQATNNAGHIVAGQFVFDAGPYLGRYTIEPVDDLYWIIHDVQ